MAKVKFWIRRDDSSAREQFARLLQAGVDVCGLPCETTQLWIGDVIYYKWSSILKAVDYLIKLQKKTKLPAIDSFDEEAEKEKYRKQMDGFCPKKR